jgi:hypothetical protein
MSDKMQDRDFETLFEDDGMRVWLRDDEVSSCSTSSREPAAGSPAF